VTRRKHNKDSPCYHQKGKEDDMKQDIKYWKERMRPHSAGFQENRLASALEQIKFLESIYITGAENNHYSKEFSAAALAERNTLCQLTSALYALKREREAANA
jgi:hypothetical protein